MKVRVGMEVIAQMLKQGHRAECTVGVPSDATIKGSYYDDHNGMFYVIFKHKTFDMVPEDKIPMMYSQYKGEDLVVHVEPEVPKKKSEKKIEKKIEKK